MEEIIMETTKVTEVAAVEKTEVAVVGTTEVAVVAPVRNAEMPKKKKNRVVLVEKPKYSVCMKLLVRKGTGIVEGCQFYITNERGVPLYDNGKELKIGLDRIRNAADHSVMNVLDKFFVNLTEDDKKNAFEKAQEYVDSLEKGDCVESSGSVDEVLRELVELAIENAKAEKKRKGENPEKLPYDYLYNENAIAIRDSCMNDLLRFVNEDYTKVTLCKKIRYIEEDLEETIIITNKGRKGYTYNMTGNNRYYVFNLNSSLLKGVA